MLGRSRQSFLVEQRALLAETPQLERPLEEIEVPTAVVTGASDHSCPSPPPVPSPGGSPERSSSSWPAGTCLPFEKPQQIAAPGAALRGARLAGQGRTAAARNA